MTNLGAEWIYQGSVAYWGLIKGHYQCQNGTEQQPLKVRGKQTCDLQWNTYLILRISPATVFKEANWALRHALHWKCHRTRSRAISVIGKWSKTLIYTLCCSSSLGNRAIASRLLLMYTFQNDAYTCSFPTRIACAVIQQIQCKCHKGGPTVSDQPKYEYEVCDVQSLQVDRMGIQWLLAQIKQSTQPSKQHFASGEEPHTSQAINR